MLVRMGTLPTEKQLCWFQYSAIKSMKLLHTFRLNSKFWTVWRILVFWRWDRKLYHLCGYVYISKLFLHRNSIMSTVNFKFDLAVLNSNRLFNLFLWYFVSDAMILMGRRSWVAWCPASSGQLDIIEWPHQQSSASCHTLLMQSNTHNKMKAW